MTRVRVQKNFVKPSLTRQAHKQECDINEIVKRFRRIYGDDCLDRVAGYCDGQYGDFSEVVDYRTALDQISQARASFDALPAIVRKQFDNDPAVFLDFVNDPANLTKLQDMGLARKSDVQDQQSQPVLSNES